MRGLLGKTLREVWVATLLIGLGLLGVNMMLTFLLPKVQEGIGDMLDRLPITKAMLGALLGTEVGQQIAAQTMTAVLWVHPIVLALIFFHAINLSTRLPAGEVDRGTIDFLLGLPVSRRQVFWAEVLVMMATGVLLIVMGFVGHRLMVPAMPVEMRPALRAAAIILANLYCVYLAVGSVGFLISSLSNYRNRAMAMIFALVAGSFLLNFVAQLWPAAKPFAPLGILEYYRPALTLQSNAVPWSDLAVLFAISAVSLLSASEIMARRSLCTT